MIKIYHGIYDPIAGPRTREKENKTCHYIQMSIKLRAYLNKKFRKVGALVEFTLGRDPENHIEAIAIVHPLDQFSRKTGVKIVTSRIKEFKKNGCNTNTPHIDKKGILRYKYPWIYKLVR